VEAVGAMTVIASPSPARTGDSYWHRGVGLGCYCRRCLSLVRPILPPGPSLGSRHGSVETSVAQDMKETVGALLDSPSSTGA